MNTAIIDAAQDKRLRHQLAEAVRSIRSFAIELYVAHGGWFADDARRTGAQGRGELLSLAAAAESHSPALSAELRHFASK